MTSNKMQTKGIIEISSLYANNPSDTPANYKMNLNTHVSCSKIWLDSISIPVTWNNVYRNRNNVFFNVDGTDYTYVVPPDYYDIFNLCQLLSAELTSISGQNITLANINTPSLNCRVSINCALGHTYSFRFSSSVANLLGFPSNGLIVVDPSVGYVGPYHTRRESFERIYVFLDGAQVDHSYTEQVNQDKLIKVLPVTDEVRGSNLVYNEFTESYFHSNKSLNTFRVTIMNENQDFIEFNGGNTYISINYD